MEQAELDHLRQQFDEVVRTRFPDAPIVEVAVLQYGDDPEIEPGQLLGRVVVDARGGTDETPQGLSCQIGCSGRCGQRFFVGGC